MAKLLCNFVLNRRRFILNESVCLKSVASFGGKLPAISGCGSSYRHHHNRSDHSNQQHNNRKINSKVFLWAAAPTFVAFFNKPEGADDETLSWFERLLPYKLRIFFQKVDDSPEGQLTMMIKRAIICIQENEVEKAEQMLHLALRMAQEMQHFDGITMCFDIMANLALEVEQYEKAEKLFVAVLQRLLQQGTEKNDLKVNDCAIRKRFVLNIDPILITLHISGAAHQFENCPNCREPITTRKGWARLSMGIGRIGKIGENRQQRSGPIWAMGSSQRLVNIHNAFLPFVGPLSSIQFDHFSYGKFLMQTGNYTQARNHLTTSYNVYTHIHGTDDPVVVDMLNNLAAVCTNVSSRFQLSLVSGLRFNSFAFIIIILAWRLHSRRSIPHRSSRIGQEISWIFRDRNLSCEYGDGVHE